MPRIFSGVQPTNNLHIGNYLGAIKNWVDLQKDNECFFCVVDMHAITVKQDPSALKKNIINMAKTYLACGIDPNKSVIFVQSEVKEHVEAAWILNTITKISELERMTQFKDKSAQNKSNINLGLFSYPVLMAADILLYDTDLVPVGEDQTQHIELACELAQRFNKIFNKTFTIPKGLVKKESARIMGLDDPSKKMSKTADSEYNYISLLDNAKVARKKIMKSVTDSGSAVSSSQDKPAITNLLKIYSLFSDVSIKEIEQQYAGIGYGKFKSGLADEICNFLVGFQDRFNKISDKQVIQILEQGAQKAEKIAGAKMEKIKKAIGLGV
ncbi:MAG: tryptophan--tRNA ligase [bacterium]